MCVTLCTLEVQAVCNVCCLREGLCSHVCHLWHPLGAGRVQCVLFAGGPMLPCVSLVYARGAGRVQCVLFAGGPVHPVV
jgi:hypothetical protein